MGKNKIDIFLDELIAKKAAEELEHKYLHKRVSSSSISKKNTQPKTYNVPENSFYSFNETLFSLLRKENDCDCIIVGSLDETETLVGAESWLMDSCRHNVARVAEEETKIRWLCEDCGLKHSFNEIEKMGYRYGKECLVTHTTYSVTVNFSDITRLKKSLQLDS